MDRIGVAETVVGVVAGPAAQHFDPLDVEDVDHRDRDRNLLEVLANPPGIMAIRPPASTIVAVLQTEEISCGSEA